MSDENVVEIKAVQDDGVIGEGMLHFVFPPHNKNDMEKVLHSNITGGVWIKKGTIVPDKLVITLG